jgi:chaperonin GroES
VPSDDNDTASQPADSDLQIDSADLIEQADPIEAVAPDPIQEVAPDLAASLPGNPPSGRPGDTLADRLSGPPGSDKLPIKMMSDRILVRLGNGEGERRSTGGILIPATAQMGKRLAWAEVVAIGANVRQMEAGDHVLFNPEDRYEVEVRGEDYVILRERDVHAVAASRLEEGSTGLYL